MKKLINLLKEKGIEIHLISATCPLYVRIKLEWIEEQYGIKMINSCAEHIQDKAEKKRDYCTERGLKPEEVLFVDDYFRSVEDAAIGCRYVVLWRLLILLII